MKDSSRYLTQLYVGTRTQLCRRRLQRSRSGTVSRCHGGFVIRRLGLGGLVFQAFRHQIGNQGRVLSSAARSRLSAPNSCDVRRKDEGSLRNFIREELRIKAWLMCGFCEPARCRESVACVGLGSWGRCSGRQNGH